MQAKDKDRSLHCVVEVHGGRRHADGRRADAAAVRHAAPVPGAVVAGAPQREGTTGDLRSHERSARQPRKETKLEIADDVAPPGLLRLFAATLR